MVNGLAEHVEHAPEAFLADRHLDWCSGILCVHAAHDAVCRAHRYAAGHIVSQMLHDLDNDVDVNILTRLARYMDSVQDARQLTGLEFNINNRPDDLYDFTFVSQS